MTMTPGVYPNLSREDYEAIDAVNWSYLKHFDRSAAHARQYRTHPKPPTPALILGNQIHTAILEPAVFKKEFAVLPGKIDRRTKAGKQAWADWEAENTGKEAVTADTWEVCTEVSNAMRLHSTLMPLMTGPGANELTIVYDIEIPDIGSVRCKSRLDRVVQYDGFTWIIDFKSCQDASAFSFCRDAARYQYDGQAAMYHDGLNVAAPFEGQRRYLLAAFEKDAPFGVAVYEVGPDEFRSGRQKYTRYMYLHAKCEKAGLFPCYDEDIQPLLMPRWAYGEE